MSWTFHPELTRFDLNVERDTSTDGRYTFKQYLYFEPSQYENWRISEAYEGDPPYSAELIGNENIPSAGTRLSGELSAFYVKDVLEIRNLNSEDNGEATSYGVVTLEYENMRSNTGDSSSKTYIYGANADDPNAPPWQQHVQDFTVTWQEESIPLLQALNLTNGKYEPLCTTAGQRFYDQTTSKYIARVTWTYYSDSTVSYFQEPTINYSTVTINNFTFLPGQGLMLPATRRTLYWRKNNESPLKTYYGYSFEAIWRKDGHNLELLNAGTQSKFHYSAVPSAVYDIFSWYVYEPNGATSVNVGGYNLATNSKRYGDYSEMIKSKTYAYKYNESVTDNINKLEFNGAQIQNPVPLDGNGYIDFGALADPSLTLIKIYRKYNVEDWSNHYGWR